MIFFTFKKKQVGNSLSVNNTFKSFVMLVVMMLMTASDAFAEVYEQTIDGLRYQLDSKTKTAELLPLDIGKYSGNINIPEKVKGNDDVEYSVTSLGIGCFSDCSSLTSITIPSTVTSLGDYCFYGCDGLESVYFKGKLPAFTGFFSYYSGMGIPTTCIIKVPTEYLEDYKKAFGSDYQYIYAWNPDEDPSGINHAQIRGIVASANDGIVSISGLNDGEKVQFYAADGKLIGSASAIGGVASCAVSGTLVIAKIGSNAIKIAVK